LVSSFENRIETLARFGSARERISEWRDVRIGIFLVSVMDSCLRRNDGERDEKLHGNFRTFRVGEGVDFGVERFENWYIFGFGDGFLYL